MNPAPLLARPGPARQLWITCPRVLRSGAGDANPRSATRAPSSPPPPPPPPLAGVGVGHAAPGESGRRLPGAPNTDSPRGRERERGEGRGAKLRRGGVEIKGSGGERGDGGEEGQMGRGRKEREEEGRGRQAQTEMNSLHQAALQRSLERSGRLLAEGAEDWILT